MRRGGGGGGGGGGRGGRGRRDARPGGARDDRDRHGRRPDYRPRRSPSPDHRARRPRDGDGDRDRDPPRRGQRDYGRVPYRQERDRYDHAGRGDRGPSGSYGGRGDSGRYDAPPYYMLPDHPSDLERPSLSATRKETEFFGGPSGRSLDKDSEFFGGPGGRRDNKESDFLGDAGMTLRVSATGLGRTSALYLDRRSPLPPPPPAVSPPPRALYPSVPPTEAEFPTRGPMMKARESFGPGSTRLLHDNREFQYHDHLRDPYAGRGREIERLYPGRDLLVDRDGEMDRLYSSRGVLGSDIVPYTQLKAYAGSSSSVLAKDHSYGVHGEPGYEPSNGYVMDSLGRPSHDSLGHGSVHARRFSERSLELDTGHDDKTLLDITRQTHSKHPPRAAASMEYDAHEYGRRDPENDTYLVLGSSPLTGPKDERINRQVRLPRRMAEGEDAFRSMHHDMEHNMQHSYHGDAPTRYHKTRDVHLRYSHSPETEPLALARRPVRQHEFASFEDGRELSDQEVSPIAYRRRSRSAAYRDHEMDIYQADDSPPGQEYYEDGMDANERMSRSYDMVDDEDAYDAGYDMPASRNVFSRIALPNDINEEWTDADQGNYPHSDMLACGRSKCKPIYERLSIPISQSQFGGSAMHGRGRGGWSKSAKKRSRISLPQFHGGYISERSEFVRPNKFLKMSGDNHNGTELNHEDAPEDEDPSMQRDPPEGSDEFSKQVHQAFLKYTKMLNESSTMKKRYCEAPKGSLSCCVCGSVARKFPDIDALISHAYDTCKVGLKTKHLGLRKALCVLMGWNWHVAPDTSKAYHSIPAEEVNDMKGDLMLWPPVVVIHNSSIVNKSKATEAKIVSIEEIEGVLTDIGLACEKAKVSHGRPANQSVFLVKFLPTISGFQEAVRIHEHFTSNNHGKEEFQQIKGGKGKRTAPVDKLEELLYAHIAVAEDLGYLDDETKRRCVVRSKNDIEARADATLNLDS